LCREAEIALARFKTCQVLKMVLIRLVLPLILTTVVSLDVRAELPIFSVGFEETIEPLMFNLI
jgi:hypothetical protein